jgi:hypothetical protein
VFSSSDVFSLGLLILHSTLLIKGGGSIEKKSSNRSFPVLSPLSLLF